MTDPSAGQAQPVIRKATPDDAAPIRHMHAQSWRDTYPSEANGVTRQWVHEITAGWLTPEKLAESREFFVTLLADKKQFYRVAEQDGQIAGFIHGVQKDDGSGFLWGLYVGKSRHGTGLSQRLMRGLNEFFCSRAVDKVALDVAAYNARAIRFYEKHGFKIAPAPGSEHLIFGTSPAIRMEKMIDAPVQPR
jgi:ribosomal protein S18 acetylase RimI-like enzyme